MGSDESSKKAQRNEADTPIVCAYFDSVSLIEHKKVHISLDLDANKLVIEKTANTGQTQGCFGISTNKIDRNQKQKKPQKCCGSNGSKAFCI